MYLSLENIVKVFPPRGGSSEVTAVEDVSLRIERGELVTLLGPSGCGKTTTLRLIAGFEFPTAGRIWLDGRDIKDLPPHRRDMSMVFQSYAIFPHLTVFENVAYGLNVQHLARVEILRRVGRALELVALTGYENRAPNQLSGGQQQRVALARALVMEPKVLLMDEPLSNLDAKLRDQMRGEIRRIQRQLGITSVYVTHDQVEAMTLSDRIVVMKDGRIDQVGTPSEVYRQPRTRFVAGFIGRANFIQGQVLGREDGHLQVGALGAVLTVPAPVVTYASGQPVTLLLRPEMAEIAPVDAAQVTPPDQGQFAKPGPPGLTTTSGPSEAISGIVRAAAYLGSRIEYDVEVDGQMLALVEHDPRRAAIHAEGEAVIISFLEDCLYVMPEA